MLTHIFGDSQFVIEWAMGKAVLRPLLFTAVQALDAVCSGSNPPFQPSNIFPFVSLLQWGGRQAFEAVSWHDGREALFY